MSEQQATHPHSHGHLAGSYRRMLERVGRERLDRTLAEAIAWAQEKAIELEELSREEAERIGGYLARDLHDAAHYLEQSGTELGPWFRMDLALIETQLLELFGQAADQTRLELAELAQRAFDAEHRYHAGEVSGPGSLACTHCGHELNFPAPAELPICPECGNPAYQRLPLGV